MSADQILYRIPGGRGVQSSLYDMGGGTVSTFNKGGTHKRGCTYLCIHKTYGMLIARREIAFGMSGHLEECFFFVFQLLAYILMYSTYFNNCMKKGSMLLCLIRWKHIIGTEKERGRRGLCGVWCMVKSMQLLFRNTLFARSTCLYGCKRNIE